MLENPGKETQTIQGAASPFKPTSTTLEEEQLVETDEREHSDTTQPLEPETGRTRADSGGHAEFLEKTPENIIGRERSGNRVLDVQSGYAFSLNEADWPTKIPNRERSGRRRIDVEAGYASYLTPEYSTKNTHAFKKTFQTLKISPVDLEPIQNPTPSTPKLS